MNKSFVKMCATAARLAFVMGAFALTVQVANGQPWTNQFDAPGDGFCEASGLALDQAGDVFVTGGATGPEGSSTHYGTVAYSTAGVPLWTNWSDGPGGVGGWALAIAAGSNIVCVTGYTGETNGNYDFTTVAYSISGVALWTNTYDGGEGENVGLAIAIGPNDMVYALGDAATTNVNGDLVTICYSSLGEPLWTNTCATVAQFISDNRSIAVDTNGDVFVVGWTTLPGAYSDYVTLAYSPSGAPLWTNFFYGPGNSIAVALDASGNAYVTGSIGSEYFATLAYSLAGNALWTNWYADGGSGQAEAEAIAADDLGHIYVTGNATTNASYFPSYVTVAYSNEGTALWTNQYFGGAYSTPSAMTTDAAGNVYVTGSSALLSEVFGYATIAYTCNGWPLWTNRYDSTESGNSQPVGVKVDSAGNVNVTGTASLTNGQWAYVTIKYAPPLVLVSPHMGVGADGGNFVFDVCGPVGASAVVQESYDLLTWTALATNTLAGGLFHFSEALGTNQAPRFYRVTGP
ncbi:MAG TPA: hypothetical protein VGR14_15050 [Verrucomicrobiae bacterium]|nr:hypothetical protein [Verrucomicrobiae bacterium]